VHCEFAELIACAAGAPSAQQLLQQGLQVTCRALALLSAMLQCYHSTAMTAVVQPATWSLHELSTFLPQDARLPLLELEDVLPASMGVQPEPPVDAGRSDALPSRIRVACPGSTL
jgi:hypothetical protein